MTERRSGSIAIDATRMRWIMSGETLDIGDPTSCSNGRRCSTARPPGRCSTPRPAGLYWAGDLGAAPGPDAPVYAAEAPADMGAAVHGAVRRRTGPAAPQPGHEVLDGIVASILAAA